MQFPVWYQGKILFGPGGLAMSKDCCCGQEYCIEGGPYCGCVMPGAPPEPYINKYDQVECPRRFSGNTDCGLGYYGRGSTGTGVAIENLYCKFFEPSNPFAEELVQVGESYRCGDCSLWFALDAVILPGPPGFPPEYVHVQLGFEEPDPFGIYAGLECVWVIYFSRAAFDCINTRFEVAPASCSGLVTGTQYEGSDWPQTWSFNVVGGRPA